MSEKNGPFEAAIAVLKTELQECSPDEEDEFCDFIQSLTDNQYEKGLRIAIRVLEVAGKVDGKQLCEYQRGIVNTLNTTRVSAGGIPLGENSADIQILALLEFLPEKEKK